jgi:hypothetical protein
MVFRQGIKKTVNHPMENPAAPRMPSTTAVGNPISSFSNREAESPEITPTANPINAAVIARKVSERDGGVNTKPF